MKALISLSICAVHLNQECIKASGGYVHIVAPILEVYKHIYYGPKKMSSFLIILGINEMYGIKTRHVTFYKSIILFPWTKIRKKNTNNVMNSFFTLIVTVD